MSRRGVWEGPHCTEGSLTSCRVEVRRTGMDCVNGRYGSLQEGHDGHDAAADETLRQAVKEYQTGNYRGGLALVLPLLRGRSSRRARSGMR
jgi:hypothetical protein